MARSWREINGGRVENMMGEGEIGGRRVENMVSERKKHKVIKKYYENGKDYKTLYLIINYNETEYN